MIKILGICGSPRRDGNTEQALIEALKAAESVGEVQSELITLANKDIKHCNGCERCLTDGTIQYPCPSIKDDMTEIYPKMASADGFIFASPVYYYSITSLMKAFIDRLLPFSTGFYLPDGKAEFKELLRFKPAGAIAVGGGRNDGIETTLYTLYRTFISNDMIVVGTQLVGHTDMTTAIGGVLMTESKPYALEKDKGGLSTVRIVGKKVAILAKILKSVRPKLEEEHEINLKGIYEV